MFDFEILQEKGLIWFSLAAVFDAVVNVLIYLIYLTLEKINMYCVPWVYSDYHDSTSYKLLINPIPAVHHQPPKDDVGESSARRVYL